MSIHTLASVPRQVAGGEQERPRTDLEINSKSGPYQWRIFAQTGSVSGVASYSPSTTTGVIVGEYCVRIGLRTTYFSDEQYPVRAKDSTEINVTRRCRMGSLKGAILLSYAFLRRDRKSKIVEGFEWRRERWIQRRMKSTTRLFSLFFFLDYGK